MNVISRLQLEDGSSLELIECKVQDLAAQGIGTANGTAGNQCFGDVSSGGYHNRLVRALYDPVARVLVSKAHIKMQTANSALKVARFANKGGGHLVFDGPSKCWPGFMEFSL
jgi:hypothetical protein